MPSFVSRIIMLIRKIRDRGLLWGLRRLAIEVAQPTTMPSRILRPLFFLFRNLILASKRILNRQSYLKFDPSGQTLYFFLDLETAPITYNVVDELIAAEMMRRRLSLQHIHIFIVPGHEDGLRFEDPFYESIVNRDARWWRLHHLVIPLFFLLPSCRSYAVLPSRASADKIFELIDAPVFPTGYRPNFPKSIQRSAVFDAFRQGEPVFPAFIAPAYAQNAVRRWLDHTAGKRRPIAVTIRQYSYMPQRNSRLSEWLKFLEGLDRSLYCPILVPDTEAAMEPLPEARSDIAIFSAAAWNQPLRLALYEQAWLNMATVHGPTELCWYSEMSRYLLFMETDTAPQTARALLISDGFEIGGQLPWSSPLQRWVWEPDVVTNIRREFDRTVNTIEAFESKRQSL